MLEAGGIDKLVNQKADAYRSNPQALQQRYSQNQELMDLLAMQKLKTEKETVARDMALKAEQTPGTIAEQYEQQLVSMNKDQMARQTAGILGERQKKAQQKSQSMGMPPQQPQGQRPPMPQGAPQGIASQPRPNMQGMASGGIVGYEEGGKVSKLEKALQALGISYKDYMAMRPEQKKGIDAQIQQEYVKQRKEFTPDFGAVGRLMSKLGPAEGLEERKKALISSGLSEEEAVREERRARMNPTAEEKAQAGLGNLLADKELLAGEEEDMTRIAAATAAATATAATATDPTTGGVATLPVDPSAGVNTNLERVGLDVDSLSATPDISGISRTQIQDSLAGTGVTEGLKKDIATDPTKVQKDEIARMSSDDKDAGGFDRVGQKAMYDKYLGEKETLDAKALSPAEVEKRRRRKAIQGFMSEGTSRGTGIAQAKFDDDLAKSRQGSILQRLSIEKQGMDNDVKIVTAINEEAGRALGRVMGARSKAMDVMSVMSANEIKIAESQADRAYLANQNGIKNKVDALAADSLAKLREMQQTNASEIAIGREMARLSEASTKFRAEYLAPVMAKISTLRQKEATKGLTEDEAALLAGYEVEFQKTFEKTKIDDALKYYTKRLEEMSAAGGSSTPSPTADPNVAAKANSYIQP
tara:strand:- start:1764 stop:3698 length:1935 start_codon:yes stop_codon:yes gene_type:complete